MVNCNCDICNNIVNKYENVIELENIKKERSDNLPFFWILKNLNSTNEKVMICLNCFDNLNDEMWKKHKSLKTEVIKKLSN
jgi:hypothetical protein